MCMSAGAGMAHPWPGICIAQQRIAWHGTATAVSLERPPLVQGLPHPHCQRAATGGHRTAWSEEAQQTHATPRIQASVRLMHGSICMSKHADVQRGHLHSACTASHGMHSRTTAGTAHLLQPQVEGQPLAISCSRGVHASMLSVACASATAAPGYDSTQPQQMPHAVHSR